MFVLTFRPLILCYSFFLPDVSLRIEPCKVFLNSSPLLLLKAINELCTFMAPRVETDAAEGEDPRFMND